MVLHDPIGHEVPSVVAVLCVIPSGYGASHRDNLMHLPWTEMSKKNGYVYVYIS